MVTSNIYSSRGQMSNEQQAAGSGQWAVVCSQNIVMIQHSLLHSFSIPTARCPLPAARCLLIH
jgi:hypothetical protein